MGIRSVGFRVTSIHIFFELMIHNSYIKNVIPSSFLYAIQFTSIIFLKLMIVLQEAKKNCSNSQIVELWNSSLNANRFGGDN